MQIDITKNRKKSKNGRVIAQSPTKYCQKKEKKRLTK